MDKIRQIPHIKLIALGIGLLGFLALFLVVFTQNSQKSQEIAKEASVTETPESYNTVATQEQKAPISVTPTTSTIPAPTVTLAPKDSWQTHSAALYTIQYPPEWYVESSPLEDGGEITSFQPKVLPSNFIFGLTVTVLKASAPSAGGLVNTGPFTLQAMGYTKSEEQLGAIVYEKLTRKAEGELVNGKLIVSSVYQTFYNTQKNGLNYSVGYKYSAATPNNVYDALLREILLTFTIK